MHLLRQLIHSLILLLISLDEILNNAIQAAYFVLFLLQCCVSGQVTVFLLQLLVLQQLILFVLRLSKSVLLSAELVLSRLTTLLPDSNRSPTCYYSPNSFLCSVVSAS